MRSLKYQATKRSLLESKSLPFVVSDRRLPLHGLFVGISYCIFSICSAPTLLHAQGDRSVGMEFDGSKRVTFNQDVAKIIHQRCTSCHRKGQVGPFPLVSYRDVARRARTIQAVIDQGYMPPWKPVNSNQHFRNDRRMTANEKALLKRWIKQGKPQGAGDAPKPPEFPDGWQLGEPDLVVSMKRGFQIPASGPDVYRSFVFPIALKKDQWVKAIDYHPTAKTAVHHAIFFVDEGGQARKMDGKDGKAGIAGMGFVGAAPLNKLSDSGSLQEDRNFFKRISDIRKGADQATIPRALNRGLGAYVPGWTPHRLPGDLAMLLPAKSDIVMQTHFHPSGKEEVEQGKLAIYFADGPPTKKLVMIQVPAMFGVGMGLKVPAGDANYTMEDSFRIPVDVQLISIGAHAHYIGKDVKMVAHLPDGSKLELLHIDDWDLDWQDRYYFESPVNLPAGTVLKSQLIYDNSANNPENPNQPPQEIRWGRQSGDEMGSVSLQVVAADESQRLELQTAVGKYFAESITRGDLVSMLMQLDANRDGALQKDETPPRLASRFQLLDRNKDGKLDANELAILKWLVKNSGR